MRLFLGNDASRPAREGEVYVTTRFPTGSLGLAVPGDLKTAICVQCDTTLELENLPPQIQDAYGLKAGEQVTFTRLEKGPYRDAVRFANGREVSLQHLGPDIRVSLTNPAPQAGESEGKSAVWKRILQSA